MIKVGFIGNGKSTHRYHLPFMSKELFNLVAIYSRSDKRFEMEYIKDYDKYDDLEAFFALDLDVVIITTPPKFHYQYAKLALLKGFNVIVDKPFCEKLSEVDELYKIANANNLTLIAYQNRRYDSDYLTFQSIIKDMDENYIMEIESNHTHYRPEGSSGWRGDCYSGSIYGHAVHFIDQIVKIFGEPDDVIYDIANQKNFYIGEGMKMSNVLPDDYYDLKLIYNNMRVRIRFSQLIVQDPPRWIVNTADFTAIKYNIDQQERDLKLGFYPDKVDFGIDLPNQNFKIYHIDQEVTNVQTQYLGYKTYYDEIATQLENNDFNEYDYHILRIVINIMQTIVENKKYEKNTH
jgi:predicted dehydrogenase